MDSFNHHSNPPQPETLGLPREALITEFPYPLFSLDANGIITYLNPAAEALLKITFAGIRNIPLWEIIPALKNTELPIQCRTASTEGICEFNDLSFPQSTQLYRVIAYSMNIGVGVICEPIIERQSDVKEIGEPWTFTEERFSKILQQTEAISAVMTLYGDFRMVNDSATKFIGYSREEILGGNLFDFLHHDEIPAAKANMEQLRQGVRNGYQLERRYLHKNGHTVWGRLTTSVYRDAEGSPLGLIVLLTDITEHKRAEEELRKQNNLFQVIKEMAKIGVWHYDIATDVADCSPETYEIIGLEKGTPINQERFVACLAPEERSSCIQVITHAVEKHITFEDERRVIQPRGDVRWITGRGWCVYSEAGEPIRLEGVVMDITDRKRLEMQLRESQKMEGIGRLAGGIAHDFNNLLTVILGHAELMKRNVVEDEQSYGSLQTIETAALRAAELTRQLLAFARRQATNPRLINLNELLQNMTAMLHPLLGEMISLVMRPASHLWKVKADANQIEQVIVNLAVNARDAMPHGGRFTIETRNITLDPLLFQGNGDIIAGDYVMVSLTDTGVGMTQDVKSRIFEPFYTTKDVGKGTGLGLATCYGILQQHGGYIHVYSEFGVGTTFNLYFPRAKGTMRKEDNDKESSIEAQQRFETILVAEDEELVRKLMVSILNKCGYHVIEVNDGEEALKMAREYSGTIHLMLSDILMPRMNGYELARRICTMRPEMRVVFVSGYNQETIKQEEDFASRYPLLAKPFNANELLSVIEESLDNTQGCGAAE